MWERDQELAGVEGIAAKEVVALAACGLRSVGQLLEWLPRRYEDRRRFDAFPLQAGGAAVCLRGVVVDAAKRGFGGKRGFYEAVVMDGSGGVFGSGKVTCRWFNMPFIHRMVATGHEVIVYGKVKESAGRLMIDHPEFEIVRDDGDERLHVERVVPIYRQVGGISQRRMREIQYRLLEGVVMESMDYGVEVDDGWTRQEALRAVHFPETLEMAERARRRFALEEFVGVQLNVVWRRRRHLGRAGRVQGRRTVLLRRFYEGLPFDLTEAQKRSIREIVADMREARPMSRLLQGDVGSGKTLVALAAMLMAVDSGGQAAMMAPTQILAEQHFLTFRKWLEPLGVTVALQTAAKEEVSGRGEVQVWVGTHALLHEREKFRDLSLVVIDEQHKFGVMQRSRLIERGTMPDVLVMTATPIPRTLTMTLYGDLDVSVLDERPAGRGKMVTALRVGAKQTEVTKFVKDQLETGRQAYLVYPLVEDSEALKVESATKAYEKWCKRLSGHAVGLVHGKMDGEEKEAVMKRFREGEVKALVATTVIEVGVDVPNANLMILHHAERFGLAQLHQLRGRIGRGEHKSYCILLTDGKSVEGMEKLRVLEGTADGFQIAEEDLRLRGPGDVLGTLQSGQGELRFADYLADVGMLRQARVVAEGILDEDPELDGRYAVLRKWIVEEGEVSIRRD